MPIRRGLPGDAVSHWSALATQRGGYTCQAEQGFQCFRRVYYRRGTRDELAAPDL
ncbi:hypothetical protein NX761_13945 [Nitrosomonas sp. PLL12]|nr:MULTISPECIES: hypothetical protein [Nitrosomonas]UVS60594.1 hypothetical protein NX761_13945 [Nitrosomonas sp. PLL12]